MKRFVCLLLCLCLCGCTKISGSLQNRLNTALAEAERAPVNAPNNRKTFYSYYLDPSLGRIYSTETGNVFSRGGRSFVMNLDIASIINDKYYPSKDNPHAFALTGTKIAERTGVYTDAEGNETGYRVTIREYVEDEVIISAECGFMRFDSLCTYVEAPGMAAAMLEISRSVTVATSEVLSAYTIREGIDYAGTPVELFEDKAPENGSIEELLVGYDGRSSSESQETQEQTPQNNE